MKRLLILPLLLTSLSLNAVRPTDIIADNISERPFTRTTFKNLYLVYRAACHSEMQNPSSRSLNKDTNPKRHELNDKIHVMAIQTLPTLQSNVSTLRNRLHYAEEKHGESNLNASPDFIRELRVQAADAENAYQDATSSFEALKAEYKRCFNPTPLESARDSLRELVNYYGDFMHKEQPFVDHRARAHAQQHILGRYLSIFSDNESASPLINDALRDFLKQAEQDYQNIYGGDAECSIKLPN